MFVPQEICPRLAKDFPIVNSSSYYTIWCTDYTYDNDAEYDMEIGLKQSDVIDWFIEAWFMVIWNKVAPIAIDDVMISIVSYKLWWRHAWYVYDRSTSIPLEEISGSTLDKIKLQAIKIESVLSECTVIAKLSSDWLMIK